MKNIFIILYILLSNVIYSQDLTDEYLQNDYPEDISEMEKITGSLREQYFETPQANPVDGLDSVISKVSQQNSQKIVSTRTVPLEETHVKLNDGTYKAKYDTYYPGEDNEALNANKNKNNYFDILVILLIVISLSILVIFILKKLKPKTTQFKSANNFGNELTFSKQKFTDGLFYKTSNSSIILNDDIVFVNVFPNMVYSGNYEVKQKLINNNFNIVRYITSNKNGQEFIIDCENNNRTIKIYNSNKEGIILKR